jgi:hypothetical protein
MAMKQYNLTVEDEIWKKVKSKAALDGITLKEAIGGLLKGWIDGELKIVKK